MKLSNGLLLSATIAEAFGEYALHRRQDNEGISVSTIPQSLTTSTSIYTTEAEGGNDTPTTVTAPTTTTTVVIDRTALVEIDSQSDSVVQFSPITTVYEDSTYTFQTTSTSIKVPVSTLSTKIAQSNTVITVSSHVTQVDVGTTQVEITVPSTTTIVDLSELDTTITVTSTTTSSTTFSNIPATVEGSPDASKNFDIGTVLTFPVTSITVTVTSTVVTVTIPTTTTSVTLTGEKGSTTVTSVTTITIPESYVTYTVEVTSSDESSDTSESSEDSSSSSEESSDTTETLDTTETSSEEDTTSESETSSSPDTTADTDTTFSTSSSSSSSSSPTTVQTPTTNPTYCEVTRNTLTPEEEVQLAVLFGDSSGGTTFADYVVSYASRLVAQIADVANIAVGDNNYAFTTAFDTIDVPGVLGLTSAAPIYTCFLSTLWAQALANPQQYAKRAVPSEDEKIKLIVLFEKRATDGMQFDYAELLVDDTNSLISDVQSVAGAAGAAAVGGDLSAYASLFANVDVAQFLSIATEAPIYTEALSSAFVTALESYSQAVYASTTVVMTTNTYTTVSTIVTNVVNGTLTIPTTYYSTVIRTSVGPLNTERETRTSHTTETRIGVTSETVSEVVRESTLPNGQVTRITETVVAGAVGATGVTGIPAAQSTARVTEEIVTANGRVETRTVTRREGTTTAVAAVETPRHSVAYYTQVQSGRTYIHTVEIQHINDGFKKVAAMEAGLLGAAMLLL